MYTVHSPIIRWDENLIYPLYIANGVTGIRDMGGDLDLLQHRRLRIERGELLGPHMTMAGPFLAGSKPDRQTIQVKTAEDGRAAVDTVKDRGADFVKILSNVPHDAYLAIASQSAKDKMRFVGHIPYSVSAREASAAGQHSIEHLGEILLACSSREDELRKQRLEALAKRDYATFNSLDMQTIATYDKDKAWNLFVQFANNNNWQVPTLVWTEANANLDNPDLRNDPRLKYVPASVRKQWDPAKILEHTTPQEFADAKTQAARLVELAGAMQRAGVPFLAGTDGPDPYVYPGFSLHDELGWLVKAGFTPLQALQSATYYPALFMTKLNQYGVVEPGHVADLVLLDGNPLDDIANTRRISGMVVNGAYYSRADLDKVLAAAAELAASE